MLVDDAYRSSWGGLAEWPGSVGLLADDEWSTSSAVDVDVFDAVDSVADWAAEAEVVEDEVSASGA